MPPKSKPTGKPSIADKIKASMEAKRKQEEELKKQEDDDQKRLEEEIKLAEEQHKFELKNKAQEALLLKNNKKSEKEIQKRNAQLEALNRMRQAGMIVPNAKDEK